MVGAERDNVVNVGGVARLRLSNAPVEPRGSDLTDCFSKTHHVDVVLHNHMRYSVPFVLIVIDRG
jgi:hypothetical protein